MTADTNIQPNPDSTNAQPKENSTTPPAVQEFTYTSKSGRVHKFKTEKQRDAYARKNQRFKELGGTGGRPRKNETETVQNGEGTSTSSSALTILNNDEEKKRLELEKRDKESMAKKKSDEIKFQQTVLVIAIIISSIILVIVFFVKPDWKKLFGGSTA